VEKQEIMKIETIDTIAQQDFTIAYEILNEAGLTGRLKLIILKGEIRILPEMISNELETLDELAGCLGKEPATEYDFSLKIGGLHETR